jgi:hypothetical protein
VPNELPDRRGLILALGIVQIVLGALCGLLMLAVVVFERISVEFGTMLLGYAVPTLNLLLMGIGSVRIQSWARRATLISAFFWLGLLAIAGGALMSGQIVGNSYERFMVGAVLILALALAVALIVAYTRPSVRATFERRRAG